MNWEIAVKDIYVLTSKHELMVTTPDAEVEFGLARLDVGGESFRVRITGRGWTGASTTLRLVPIDDDLDDIAVALRGVASARLIDLRRREGRKLGRTSHSP